MTLDVDACTEQPRFAGGSALDPGRDESMLRAEIIAPRVQPNE